MDTLETRELRYFIALAEELHFGRAAERLGIAQPPLSRAIQQLERRLGAVLFERNRRGVALTDAGEVLLHEGRLGLDAVVAAGRRTQRAASSDNRLVLATKAGASHELLQHLLDAYAAEPDAAEVEVLLCGIGEQPGLLRDGRADAALVHRPYDDLAGFDSEDILTEEQVAIVPAGHPLAKRESVSLADISTVPDLPMARWPRRMAATRRAPVPRYATRRRSPSWSRSGALS